MLTYVTAYQLLHRMARARSGETVLVHGAAGRVGTAVLELGALAGLRLFGTASARDRGAVERLGAVAIDYRREDFLARVRALTGDGVDVVLDGLGGLTSLRSFRALRPGGRLVVYGHYATLAHGRKSWRAWLEWYATTAAVALCGLLAPRRRVLTYRIQKLRDSRQWFPVAGRRPARPVGGGPRDPKWFREDLSACCSSCSAGTRSTRWWPSACRYPTRAAPTRCSSARRRRENSSSCHNNARTVPPCSTRRRDHRLPLARRHIYRFPAADDRPCS